MRASYRIIIFNIAIHPHGMFADMLTVKSARILLKHSPNIYGAAAPMEKKPLCPQLLVWRQMYTVMEEACRRAGDAGMPLPPPVFNMQSWSLSTDAQKQQRWAATRVWAEQYGFEHLIEELSDDDFYDGD